MIITGTRNPILFKYKVAFTKEGYLTGLDVKVWLNAGCTMDYSCLVCDSIYVQMNILKAIPLYVKTDACELTHECVLYFVDFWHRWCNVRYFMYKMLITSQVFAAGDGLAKPILLAIQHFVDSDHHKV